MKKKAFTEASTTAVVNGYILRSYVWTQHDPDNLNTASITAVYDLAFVDADGRATPSTLPGHRGIIAGLHNVGDNQPLAEWLRESGQPNDLLDFNYHDVERLVEEDAARRFGLVITGKKG